MNRAVEPDEKALAQSAFASLIWQQLIEQKAVQAKQEADQNAGVAQFAQAAYGDLMTRFRMLRGPKGHMHAPTTIVDFHMRFSKANASLCLLDLSERTKAYQRVAVRFIHLLLAPMFATYATRELHHFNNITEPRLLFCIDALDGLYNICGGLLQQPDAELSQAISGFNRNYHNMHLNSSICGFLQYTQWRGAQLFSPGQDTWIVVVLYQYIEKFSFFRLWDVLDESPAVAPLIIPARRITAQKLATEDAADSFLRALEKESAR